MHFIGKLCCLLCSIGIKTITEYSLSQFGISQDENTHQKMTFSYCDFIAVSIFIFAFGYSF